LGVRFDASLISILARCALHIPGAWRKVTEPNQVNVVTATMLGRLEQILHTAETRFARQIIGDVRTANRPNRIDDNLPIVHAVTTTCLDMGPHPDADAAPDPPASDSFAKTFREHHDECPPTFAMSRDADYRGGAGGSIAWLDSRSPDAAITFRDRTSSHIGRGPSMRYSNKSIGTKERTYSAMTDCQRAARWKGADISKTIVAPKPEETRAVGTPARQLPRERTRFDRLVV
jgi:hypothetical protein